MNFSLLNSLKEQIKIPPNIVPNDHTNSLIAKALTLLLNLRFMYFTTFYVEIQYWYIAMPRMIIPNTNNTILFFLPIDALLLKMRYFSCGIGA